MFLLDFRCWLKKFVQRVFDAERNPTKSLFQVTTPLEAELHSLILNKREKSQSHLVVRSKLNTLKQTCQKDIPLARSAFKDLMTRGILQFALRIAFRCVLHRYGNQDIHRWKFSFIDDLVIFFEWISSNLWGKLTAELKLGSRYVLMILPQVHLRKPCYDFSFL